jgi:hypothetical protein
MARTRSRSEGTQLTVRSVRSKEDRKRPSVWIRLKMDEMFKGHALFEPDPELEDNPGYFEYYDHWDQQGQQYVPCAGEQCPFCATNDNPSTRALTAWYFPDNDAKDQIKVFAMNYGTINDISDEAEEEDGLLGKKIRIKRLDDRGSYKVRVLTDKPLTKAEQKKVMALLEEKFPDGLEGLITKQLKAQIERLKAVDALEDDDDEDEEPTKARRGRAAVADEEDEDDEEDTDDEAEDEDDEEDEDEDESEEEDEEEDEDEDEEDEDEAEEISGVEYEVVKVDEKDEIFDLKNDDGKVKMWLGEGIDVDYDEVKKGVTVTVDAQQDDEGDWIITSLEAAKPKPATRRRKATTTTRRRTSRK